MNKANYGELKPMSHEEQKVLVGYTYPNWHDVFGTSQLTHAYARLEAAESKANKKTLQPMSEEAVADLLLSLVIDSDPDKKEFTSIYAIKGRENIAKAICQTFSRPVFDRDKLARALKYSFDWVDECDFNKWLLKADRVIAILTELERGGRDDNDINNYDIDRGGMEKPVMDLRTFDMINTKYLDEYIARAEKAIKEQDPEVVACVDNLRKDGGYGGLGDYSSYEYCHWMKEKQQENAKRKDEMKP